MGHRRDLSVFSWWWWAWVVVILTQACCAFALIHYFVQDGELHRGVEDERCGVVILNPTVREDVVEVPFCADNVTVMGDTLLVTSAHGWECDGLVQREPWGGYWAWIITLNASVLVWLVAKPLAVFFNRPLNEADTGLCVTFLRGLVTFAVNALLFPVALLSPAAAGCPVIFVGILPPTISTVASILLFSVIGLAILYLAFGLVCGLEPVADGCKYLAGLAFVAVWGTLVYDLLASYVSKIVKFFPLLIMFFSSCNLDVFSADTDSNSTGAVLSFHSMTIITLVLDICTTVVPNCLMARDMYQGRRDAAAAATGVAAQQVGKPN